MGVGVGVRMAAVGVNNECSVDYATCEDVVDHADEGTRFTV